MPDHTPTKKDLADQLLTLGQTSSTETALFHHAAAAKFGLGITDVKALSILLQDGPQTAGGLTARLSLTTGAVTNIIDRLSRRGLVRRQPDPRDGRKVIVTIDRDSIAPLDNTYASMGQAFNRQLQKYSVEELTFLVRYFQETIALTRSQIAKIQRSDPTSSDQQ